MKNFLTSVICSTYNDPKYLEMVLDSLLYQTDLNFELLIADDGSGQETKIIVDNFKTKAPFNVIHVWHEDMGWRKSKIHNEAIRQSSGEHLIFMDGDCILGNNFVADHRLVFEQNLNNYVLMGRRVELSRKISSTLTLENYHQKLSLCSLKYLFSIISGETHGGLRCLSIYNKFFRMALSANSVKDLLGANYSLPRKKMYEINGFNEDTDSLGVTEDGDIFVRLRNTGTLLLGMKYFAPMFHKYHGRDSRVASEKYYQEILKDLNYIYSKNGLK